MPATREFTARWKSIGVTSVTGDMNKVATATGKVDKGLKKVDDSSVRTKRRLSEMNVTLKDLAKAGAGVAAGRWFGQAAVAASQLETNLRGVTAVLGEGTANEIATWAKEFGDQLNVSQGDAINAARGLSTYAASVRNAGGDAAVFTEDMITLAAELSSFSGADPEKVIEAIGGAMRGEFDTLQTFGVNIDSAAVNAEALKLGLADSTTELTAQDKVMATYSATMEAGAFAMGSTATNADTLSGSLADLKQKNEDLQTAVGGALAEPLANLAGIASDLAEAFGKLPGPLRVTAIGLGGLMIVKKLLGPAFSDFSTSLKNLRGEMSATAGIAGKFKAGFSGLVGMFNPWMLVMGVGITLLAAWKEDQAEAKAATDLFTDGIVAQTGALNDRGKQALANELADEVDAMELAGVTAEEVAAAIGNTDNYDDLIDKLKAVAEGHYEVKTAFNGSQQIEYKQYDETGQAALRLIKKTDELSGSYDVNKEKAQNLSIATDGVNTAAGDTTTAVKGLNDEVSSLNDQLAKLIDNYSSLRGDSLTIEEATVKISDGMEGLAKSVEENGTSLDQFTEKGAKNRLALGDIVEGTDDLVTAMIKEGATHKEVAEARRQGNEQLRETMKQAGFTKKQIDDYIKSVKKTPKQQQLELSVIFKKEKIKALDNDLTKLGDKKIELETKTTIPPGTPGPLAKLMRGEPAFKKNQSQLININTKIDLKQKEKDKLQGLHGDALIKAEWPERGEGGKNQTTHDLDEASNPGGQPRDSHFRAFIEPGAYATVKAELDKLAADREATITVTTKDGDTPTPKPGTNPRANIPSTQLAPLSLLAGAAQQLAGPAAAPFVPYIPGGSGGVQGGGTVSGPHGEKRVLLPKQQPVAVYLDGVEIANRIEARRALASTASVRRTA